MSGDHVSTAHGGEALAAARRTRARDYRARTRELAADVIPPGKKRCQACLKVRPIADFAPNERWRDGLRPRCKRCEDARFPHGIRGYSRGCRCQICTDTNSRRDRAKWASRKERQASAIKAQRRTNPAEIWMAIPGWDGLYEVSDLGRVWSVPRRGVRGGFVNPSPDPRGYLRVTLCRNGTHVKRRVHQLVAEAFIGPRPPGHEVRHGPGGKSDNRSVNLSYGTSQDNSDDMIRDGTVNHGEDVPVAKLTWSDVNEIRRRCAAGESQTALAREFGTCQSNISRIVLGKQWRAA